MMKCQFFLAAVVACSFTPVISTAEDGSFDSNGVKIHYVTEGQGEAVVLIHGWTSDVTMWGRKLQPLEGFQLIALDCRGHGKSDKPHDQAKYGAEMAGDVVRLLDHLKIKKAHLIGYSMGTFIVAKVAATHPDRVNSIIYGGQAPLIPGVHPAGSNEINVFAKAVDEGKGLGPYIIYVSPSDKPKPSLETANALGKAMMFGKDEKALAAAGLSFKGLEVSLKGLRKCRAPVLFVYGEHDLSAASIEVVRKALGPSEVKIVPGGTHFATLTKPEFGAAIVEFLRAHKEEN